MADAVRLARLAAELERIVAELRSMERTLLHEHPSRALQQVDCSVQELEAIAGLCRRLGRTDVPGAPELTPRTVVRRIMNGAGATSASGDVQLF